MRFFASLLTGLLAFFVGTRLGPLIYPYKLFTADSFGEIVFLRLRSLGDYHTYFGPYALQLYAAFTVVFSIIYLLIKIKNIYVLILYSILLGIYYDIMINGNQVALSRFYFDDLLNDYVPNLQASVSLLVPLTMMLFLPLALAYGLSRISAARQ